MRHFEAKAVVGHRGLDGDTTAHHNDYGYDYGQPGGLRMITVSKSKLKARMLEYFRMVEESGEEIVVTNHNRPVLRITASTMSTPCRSSLLTWRGSAPSVTMFLNRKPSNGRRCRDGSPGYLCAALVDS